MWFYLLHAENSQNKQIMLENEWNDIKWQFPVSLLNCLLLKILVVHCKWKAFDICCTLCILRLIISFALVSRQNFRSQTMKYSSNGCTVHFNIYNGKDAAKGMSKFGLGHDVKVRLISPYFDQCWRNMCNYHISDLLFSNQFLWRCCLYDKEPF